MSEASHDNGGSAGADGRLPILPGERVFTTFWGYTRTCVTFGSAIWIFLIGGMLPFTGSAGMGSLGYAAGLILGFVPVLLASGIVPFRYGVESIDSSKAAFGLRGSALPLVGLLLAALGWATVIMAMIAEGYATISASTPLLSAMGIGDVPSGAWALVAILCCGMLVRAGPRFLERVNNIVGPSLLLLAAALLLLLSQRFDLSELWMRETKPDLVFANEPIVGLAYAVEFGVATSLAWWPFMGGLSRLVVKRKHVLSGAMVGLTLVGGVFGATVAGLAAVGMGSPDPVVWIRQLAGPLWGTIITLAVLTANMAVMALLVYIASVSARQITGLARLPWTFVVSIMLVPSIVATFFTRWVLEHVMSVVTYTALAFVGITAVTLVDYFLLRRQNVRPAHFFANGSQSDYWFWGGVNWLAIFAVGCSSVLYLYLYDPITMKTAYAFRFLGASIPSMTVAGLVYYTLSRLISRPAGKGGYEVAGSKQGPELTVGL